MAQPPANPLHVDGREPHLTFNLEVRKALRELEILLPNNNKIPSIRSLAQPFLGDSELPITALMHWFTDAQTQVRMKAIHEALMQKKELVINLDETAADPKSPTKTSSSATTSATANVADAAKNAIKTTETRTEINMMKQDWNLVAPEWRGLIREIVNVFNSNVNHQKKCELNLIMTTMRTCCLKQLLINRSRSAKSNTN